MSRAKESGDARSLLRHALRSADAAAFLVPPRIVRRVIRHRHELLGPALFVPHRDCFVVPRRDVLTVVDRSELGITDSDRVPDPVVLVAEPEVEFPEEFGDPLVRREVWRRLFHARVHASMEERIAAGELPRRKIRSLVDRIGQVRFDEIRAVLSHEDLLLPPRDDRTVLTEFAAVYLELKAFDPEVLDVYFPSLARDPVADGILGDLVVAEPLVLATRVAGSAEALLPRSHTLPEKTEVVVSPLARPTERVRSKLNRRADRAFARGNVVRAGILRERAGDSAGASAAIDTLVSRLTESVGIGDPAMWREELSSLLARAAAGTRTISARALFDLQRVCLELERGVFAVDVVEWALTFGRRPIRRDLPSARDSLVLRHLRRAHQRLGKLRPRPERLRSEIAEILAREEREVRDEFRPRVEQVLDEVGLVPRDLPERVSRKKLVEELLDRAVVTGRLRMGDLRDAVSRNHVKLPDVRRPADVWLKHPLLMADRRLAVALDGVYSRGEFYLRWLQVISSLGMGTRVGRWLTLWVTIPFGGAFVALEGTKHIVAALGGLFGGGGHGGHGEADGHGGFNIAGMLPVIALGLGFILLMHSGTFRAFARRGISLVFRAIRDLIFRMPTWLLSVPLVARILESRPFTLILRLVIKPAVYTGLIGLVAALFGFSPFTSWTRAFGLFLLVNLISNSPPGRRGEEISLDWLARNWHFLRVRIVAGLLRFIVHLFQSIVERFDRVLYRVDEILRFRGGEGRLRLIGKGALSAVWFLGSYLIRTTINLFIEPQINPIKHFPVVTVSHKILLPALPKITEFLARPFSPLIGSVAANGLMGSAVFLMPGVFGFLVWELKENWRLFNANRTGTLKPIRVGSHGETVVRLLRPGFHSGTIPKAYARIRQAERTARESRSLRKRMRGAAAIEHVQQSLRRFVERDFAALLRESDAFGEAHVSVGSVELGSNRIAVEILREGEDDALKLAFDEDNGWMVAGLVRPGWSARLKGRERAMLENALVGFYRLCGVEIVREELDRRLRGDPYDITDDGLVVWPDATYDRELWFQLPRREGLWGGDRLVPRPELSLLFPDAHIRWNDWVATWSDPERVGKAARLLPDLSVLPPLSDP